jgi:hypothetical protein
MLEVERLVKLTAQLWVGAKFAWNWRATAVFIAFSALLVCEK